MAFEESDLGSLIHRLAKALFTAETEGIHYYKVKNPFSSQKK
jgi:hypothetical protein